MTSRDAALGRAGALLTIDLDAIVENWRRLAARAAPAECGAVLKADGYGLGAVRIGTALAAAGARTFFVAHLDEAIALRAALADARIVVLNGLLPGFAVEYVAHRLVPALNDPAEIAAWGTEARTLGTALPGFVHLDTGMNRLGLMPQDQDRLAADPTVLDGIAPLAWMTHLACAEDSEALMNRAQLQQFRSAVARLPAAPLSIANSSAHFLGSDFQGDITRPGAALFGLNPTPGQPNPMTDVVRLDARILQTRRVDTPMTVGYGAAHRVEGPARIATIAIGYADGFLRSLSSRGAVRIAGFTAPIAGRISMDLITVDVTHIPETLAVPGALAEIIGPHLPVDRVAEAGGTIGYEILTGLGHRYARHYIGGAA